MSLVYLGLLDFFLLCFDFSLPVPEESEATEAKDKDLRRDYQILTE
jgi:hypothetical protein